MNTKLSRFLHIGPGGRRCVCCFPAPSSKARKIEYRRAKRVSKREAAQYIANALVCE